MAVELCSCEGLNPNCKICFGSGYAPSATQKKSAPKQVVKKPVSKTIPYKEAELVYHLPKKTDALTKQEIEQITIKIINALDSKSKKQLQLLNSIPFNTNTFRRDFKDKFHNLTILETEKRHLRKELMVIDQIIVDKKYDSQFSFKHFLSDKDLDITSNRQLKEILREYKRLKN
ncbi:hypothetical protein HX017_04210 [Myroides marinus]|jgi:hypothetical protein|uniref:hypothetical protein n=1 Tax=Myroides marinus TaxID=703342 RepID=UPI0007422CD9|nr:hypothetical protein [Myroides marinus]MDR0228122.1 hypothetical protein [Flavobacteriaceae bacterium]KUF41534.1 hypothetical protein AS361_14180 [Myroides marinus]MDM1348915.1 hypothetical protein [Myroides marinus]MDM1350231.1 hypothetical protein [Myroides marinus]MDM1354035.1 hypothetical protein [Myroides marinus]